jgi:hypothetical protein
MATQINFLIEKSLLIMLHVIYFVSVSGTNGNKRRSLSLKDSKVGANEAERSPFVSICTTQANKRETRGDVGREW